MRKFIKEDKIHEESVNFISIKIYYVLSKNIKIMLEGFQQLNTLMLI
jgi:hypothetical protein